MKKLYNRFIAWLFLETPKTNATNGLVKEETPYERKVKEMATEKKKPAAKKSPAKKTPVKKAPVKKTTTKKK